jgi:hypothetical protein
VFLLFSITIYVGDMLVVLFYFQVRLYESGKIALVYGACTGNPSSPTASIGINMFLGVQDGFTV